MKKLRSVLILLVCLMLVLPLFSASATPQVTRIRTTKEGATLRSATYVHKDTWLASIHENVCLDVIYEVDGWYYVCYKGMYGYVTSNPKFVTVIGTGNIEYVTRVRTNKGGASLRSTPEVQWNNKIAGVHEFTYLDVYSQLDGWYYVYYNGQWGYVSDSMVSIVGQSTQLPQPPVSNVGKIRTNSNGASLRAAPDLDSEKIASIHEYTMLEVWGQVGDWYYVSYRGMMGYVYRGMVTVMSYR